MSLGKYVSSAVLAGTILAGTPNGVQAQDSGAPTGESESCTTTVGVTQNNMYKLDGGFLVFDGPMSAVLVSQTCGKVYGFVWGGHNNQSGEWNEVDVGVGTTGTIGKDKKISYDVSLQQWWFTESGGKNTVLSGTGTYSASVNTSLNVMQIVDGSGGTQAVLSVAKPISLGKLGGWDTTLTPTAKVAYLNEFFGANGHTNNVLGVSFGAQKNGWNINATAEYHDGKGDFGNDTRIGAGVSYTF